MNRWLAVALYAASGCDPGDGFPVDAGGPPPGGTISLAWSLTNAHGNPITCEQIGALAVVLYPHDRSVQQITTEVFTCSTRAGTTTVLKPGIYDVRAELTSTSGVTLAELPEQLGLEVRSNEDTPLPPVTFAVDAQGSLDLHMTANKPAGNCAGLAMNGAGITSLSLTLTHAPGGACEPILLAIGAGATRPAGTYLINCTAPSSVPCIDADQRISAAGVKSDSYQVHIRAKVGATECYVNDDTFQVPPLGMTVVQTMNLSKLPGC